jgi:predicted metal-dependent peptidase
MIDNQGDRLKHLIAKFVLKYNYWGYLFSRIRRRPLTGFGSIMGVFAEIDGSLSLCYEPTLMAGTDDENLIKVIEHEGMHLLNKHLPRLIRILSNETDMSRKKLKIKVWNVASDCAANQQMKLFEPIIVNGDPWPPQLPAMWGMPDNEMTEKYFYWLLQNKVKTVQIPGTPGHAGWADTKGVSDLSSLARKIDHHIQDIIRESVKTFNRERGTLPSHIADLIQGALSPPKAPYYQMIQKWIKGSRYSKYKRTPTRINRKRVYVFKLGGSVIPKISPFPGKMRDLTFDIAVLIDTSGSMSNHAILEGLSGVKNIIEKDRYCYTTVLEVDAAVEKEYQVKRIRDIQFNIKGRGGTTLRPGLERARELGVDVCLAFTDGYTENINQIPRRALPKKIIWVLGPGSSAENLNQTGPVVWID